MNIVLIAPSGVVGSAMARLAVGDTDSVTVISSTTPDVESSAARCLVFSAAPGLIGATITRLMSRSTIGRNVARLTPLDGGRRLARIALRSDAVHDAVRRADLVAVLERDGILTAWKAQRRWAQDETPVVFGAAPAETTLVAMRASTY